MGHLIAKGDYLKLLYAIHLNCNNQGQSGLKGEEGLKGETGDVGEDINIKGLPGVKGDGGFMGINGDRGIKVRNLVVQLPRHVQSS